MTHLLPAAFCTGALAWGVYALLNVALCALANCDATYLEEG